MTSRLSPYIQYRPTGTSWLDDIPDHWSVVRNGSLFVERRETGFPDLPILEVSLHTGVQIRDFVDSNRKQIMSNQSGYLRAKRGDLVYNTMRMWQGAVGTAPIDGLVSPAYIVAKPLTHVESRFFTYLFRTDRYKELIEDYSRGIVSDRNRLYWDQFKQMTSLLPPLDEQRAIARFLDRQDRRINRFIQAKRRMIELLNEQKQAIIHQAVTRGLDPNVPLKPSGIDWLGDIPAHWGVIPLRQGSLDIKTGPFGSQLHASDYVDGGVPVINPSNIIEGSIRPNYQISVPETMASQLGSHRFIENDIVLARRGELGRCAVVLENEAGWLCGTGSLKIRPNQSMFNPTYLSLILSNAGMKEYLSLLSVGATMDNLNAPLVGQLRIPMPSLGIQLEISRFVSEQSRLLNATAQRALQEIDLIREYRTRLIADVVTGKLDVRNHPDAQERIADEGGDDPGLIDELVDELIDDAEVEEDDDAVAD